MFLLTFTLGAAVWILALQGAFGSWSDMVRVEIYKTAANTISSSGFSLLGMGQSTFVKEVNYLLPDIITNRIEVQHMHNAFLHIWGSYGPFAFFCFTLSILLILQLSITKQNIIVRNQIIFLIAIMQIETVLSDIRVLLAIFLFIGMQLNAVPVFKNTVSSRLQPQRRVN